MLVAVTKHHFQRNRFTFSWNQRNQHGNNNKIKERENGRGVTKSNITKTNSHWIIVA